MIGLVALGLNLSDPVFKYFDIKVEQNFFTPIFTPINITQVPMVPCT